MANQFVRLVYIVLILTAASKIWTASGEIRALATADRMFPFLSVRQTLMLFALVELGFLAIVASRRQLLEKLFYVAALAFLLLIYRTIKELLFPGQVCLCWGYIWHWIPIKPTTLDLIAQAILFVMSIASFALLWIKCKTHASQNGASSNQQEQIM